MIILHILLFILAVVGLSISFDDNNKIQFFKYDLHTKSLMLVYVSLNAVGIVSWISSSTPPLIGYISGFCVLVSAIVNGILVRAYLEDLDLDIGRKVSKAYKTSEDELYKYKVELDKFNRGELSEADIANNPYKDKENKYILWVIRIFRNTFRKLFKINQNSVRADIILVLALLTVSELICALNGVRDIRIKSSLPDELSGYQINFEISANEIRFRSDGGYQLHGGGKVTSNGKTYRVPAIIYIIPNPDQNEFNQLKAAKKKMSSYSSSYKVTYEVEGQAIFTGNKELNSGKTTVIRPILEDNDVSTFVGYVQATYID